MSRFIIIGFKRTGSRKLVTLPRRSEFLSGSWFYRYYWVAWIMREKGFLLLYEVKIQLTWWKILFNLIERKGPENVVKWINKYFVNITYSKAFSIAFAVYLLSTIFSMDPCCFILPPVILFLPCLHLLPILRFLWDSIR